MSNADEASARTRGPPPSSDFSEFGDAADLDPLHHENITRVIEARSVRADELSGNERVARLDTRSFAIAF
jgi:hypothetical protein